MRRVEERRHENRQGDVADEEGGAPPEMAKVIATKGISAPEGTRLGRSGALSFLVETDQNSGSGW